MMYRVIWQILLSEGHLEANEADLVVHNNKHMK